MIRSRGPKMRRPPQRINVPGPLRFEADRGAGRIPGRQSAGSVGVRCAEGLTSPEPRQGVA